MSLIFVGGIHGVGKGNFCRALAPLIGAVTVSAGRILTTAGLQSVEKPVSSVEANQAFLVKEVRARLRDHSVLLLDGHFALFRPDGEVSAIPVEVFEQLAPAYVVVLTAAPDLVRVRLLQRDGVAYSTDQLAALQAMELAQSSYVAGRLSVPLSVVGEDVSVQTVAQRLSPILAGEAS
jgi:adenylate kinase